MYYRLTYTASSNKETRGDYVQNGSKPLNIGQGASCNVQIPESELYEPQVYATILHKEDGKEWYIVRITDSHQVQVNGSEVPIAQILQNGDMLSFSDGTVHAELKFEKFDDGEYDINSGVVYKKHESRKQSYALVIFGISLALGISIFAIYQNQHKNLRDIDIVQYSNYVYRITVDSLYLIRDSIVDGSMCRDTVDAIELEKAAVGTAFLTDSGLIVTARHCLQPWIDDIEWDGSPNTNKMSPEVRLAVRAETENNLGEKKRYVVQSHCIISRGLDRFELSSTAFHIDESRDLVLRLGSAQSPLFWRTIIPIANRRDMELGDFAYIIIDSLRGRSKLSLATEKDMATLSASRRMQDIAVIGYPLDDNQTEDVKVVPGNMMSLVPQDEAGLYQDGCIPMSASINRGNSGGPVLAQIGNDTKVIGIVSKADWHADQGVFWTVPSTEVIHLCKKNNTEE